MSSLTTRLGLKRPITTDGFVTLDYFNNLTLLDAYPGSFICTSGTRPVGWGVGNTGQPIYETDSKLVWRWNGTGWERAAAVGELGVVEITSPFSTSSTSPTAALTANVTVPATTVGSTTKRIRVSGSWYQAYNGTLSTFGVLEISLYRTGNATPLMVQLCRGRPTTATSPLDWGIGGTIEGYDAPAVGGGAVTYTLNVNSLSTVGGTSIIAATSTTPARLVVTEVGV